MPHIYAFIYICVCGCVFVSLYAVLSQSVYLAVSASQDFLMLSLYSYLLSLSPHLRATTNLFSISIIKLFHKCNTNRSCSIYSFDNGFFSISMSSWRFIQVAIPSSLLFIAHSNSWCKRTMASLISHLVKDMGPFIFLAYYK